MADVKTGLTVCLVELKHKNLFITNDPFSRPVTKSSVLLCSSCMVKLDFFLISDTKTYTSFHHKEFICAWMNKKLKMSTSLYCPHWQKAI